MRIKHLFVAAAALSLATSAAASPSAAPLSLAASPEVRAAAADGSSELGEGRRFGWVLGLVAVGILVFVVLELQDDNELPGSP